MIRGREELQALDLLVESSEDDEEELFEEDEPAAVVEPEPRKQPKPKKKPKKNRRQPSPAKAESGSGSGPLLALSGLFSKSAFLILLSVTALNGLVALVTLRNAATMRDSVIEAQRHMAETAAEIKSDSIDQARELIAARTPLVPPDPEAHPTFERARQQILDGDFVGARQGIYALLAVIDRLEVTQRRAVEARAQYLLAEATHLEALSLMEEGE